MPEHSPLRLRDAARYDEVMWLCSHNAMSNSDDKWLMPNQIWSIKKQLDRGVHAQMWDVWMHEGEPYLRHGSGLLADPAKKKLRLACEELKAYLDKEPRAIVTLILESKVDDAPIMKTLEEAGLLSYLLPKTESRDWPTLGELRKSGKRLIIFCDRRTQSFQQLWHHAVETDWVNKDVKALTNRLRRGQKENTLFIVNHFVCNPFPNKEAAEQVNTRQRLQQRVDALQRLYARQPNFLTLDFIGCKQSVAFVHEKNAEKKLVEKK